MIKGNVKKDKIEFVSGSYQKYDAWAINIITEKLKEKGFTVKIKLKEDYKIDIDCTKNNNRYFIEVEVTSHKFTCKEDFPFPTVSFLGRKEKFKKTPFWYLIICEQTKNFLRCHSDDIFKKEYKVEVEVNTIERQGIDTFYRLEKDKCLWNDLNIDL